VPRKKKCSKGPAKSGLKKEKKRKERDLKLEDICAVEGLTPKSGKKTPRELNGRQNGKTSPNKKEKFGHPPARDGINKETWT